MSVAIIDYAAGNLTSVERALQSLDVPCQITADPERIAAAERVIFPGVGAAESCMANLRAAGMDQALADAVAAGKPVLGICVGMQLLFDHSDEDGGVDCLGLLPGRVRRFSPTQRDCKVPHMGWNEVRPTVTDEPLFADLPAGEACYFVHSFYCEPAETVLTIAESDHGESFCCGVRRDNLVAVQFHPEKSGPVGLAMLRRFCAG